MAGSISGKSLVLLSMLIGLGCVTFWALGKSSQQAAIDPAVSLMMTQPSRNSLPHFQPLHFMQPASRTVAIQAEKTPLDSGLGRRAILTGIASMTPLVAIADQAKAANKAVSPELDAELRARAGKEAISSPNVMKVKNLLEDEPPAPPPKQPIVSPGLRKKDTPADPAESAAAPSAPSLPSLPSLPKGFKFKLPGPF